MTTDAKPYPAELTYDADTGEIDCRGAAVAHMYDADDFPCLDDADREGVRRELIATGAKLVRAYNSHDELVAACRVALKRMKDSLAIRIKLTGITTGAMADEVKLIEAVLTKATGEGE